MHRLLAVSFRVSAHTGVGIRSPRPQARNSKASLCEGGSAKRRRERRCTTAPSLLVRRGRCPHRPVCRGSAAASSLPCVKGGVARKATEGLSFPGGAEPHPYTRFFGGRFVGGDAHAVERSGTSTLGVHRPAIFASYSGRDRALRPYAHLRKHPARGKTPLSTSFFQKNVVY